MQRKLVWTALLLAALNMNAFLVSRSRAETPAAASRQNVKLTVYTDDFAMVRESRPVSLAAGKGRVDLDQVSKLLDPQSALVSWGNVPGGTPVIYSQAYDLGINDPSELPARYLGKQVTVVQYGSDGRVAGSQQGTLVAVGSGGNPVLQSGGQLYVSPPGVLELPVNADLVTMPRLSVQVESPAAQDASLNLQYLTRGLAWTADYVAIMAPGSKTLQLQAWATILNRTGVDYPDASLTLVTGTPNRAVTQAQAQAMTVTTMAMAGGGGYPGMAGGMPPPPVFTPPTPQVFVSARLPAAVGDFHIYSIRNPTTVNQEQMNRVLLFSGAAVPVQRDYSVVLPPLSLYDDGSSWGGGPQKQAVQAAIQFANTKDADLGEPLPHGDVRVYEPDATASLRYTGAAAMEDTPRNQKVYLTLSNAFDLSAAARLVSQQRLSRRAIRKQVSVTLRNEKQTPVAIRVVQGFGGGWQVRKESAPHTRLTASQAQWTVLVPAGGDRTLTYTVDLGR